MTDIRLGLYHTPEDIQSGRGERWLGGNREGFTRRKARGDRKRFCEKRYLGLLRHIRYYRGKNLKNLLQGEGAGYFVVVWGWAGANWLASHKWRQGDENVGEW